MDNVEALVTVSKLCTQSTVLSVAIDVPIDGARVTPTELFDRAGGGKSTNEKIVDLFASVGMQVHGPPLQPPNIFFWNVRADTARLMKMARS